MERPTLVYDGDCGFCRRWVARWEASTGDAVQYAPYQEAAAEFPEIKIEEFEAAVKLMEPDGNVHSGAGAVFRLLSYGGGRHAGWWMYRKLPGFSAFSEFLYRFIANRRAFFSRLTYPR